MRRFIMGLGVLAVLMLVVGFAGAENEKKEGKGGRRAGAGGRGPGLTMVFSPFVQERLKLTEEQKEKIGHLHKEVDTKLSSILTDEQKKELREMRPGGGRGPGGRRGPGGEGGRRGPGGEAPPPPQ